MTSAQKWIAICGLVVIALAATKAPYDYESRDVQTGLEVNGTVYRPFWDAPSAGHMPAWLDVPDNPRVWWPTVTSVRLDAGKLGLEWAGIVLASIVGIVLASPKREAA